MGRVVWEEYPDLAVTLSSIGDAVIPTDATGRVTFMNVVAEQLTGWTVTEASGPSLTDVFRIVNEQTRQPVEDPVATGGRTGRRTSSSIRSSCWSGSRR